VPIEILDETGRFRSAKRIGAVLERVAEDLAFSAALRHAEMTLVFVDDATIRARNAADRDVDEATDVLAYPLHEPDDVGVPDVPHLGDVLVSVDTAQRQARARGVQTWVEATTLAAHGMMHLWGFDHQEAADWAPFEAAQALAEAACRSDDAARAARRLLRARSSARRA
jgi:probable rRNA maturation factor